MRTRFRYEISVGLFVVAAALLLGFISLKISRARVRVEKPLALAPHAAAAGVEITAVRA